MQDSTVIRSTQSIIPFWRLMPQFFRAPLNATSLIYMAILSMVQIMAVFSIKGWLVFGLGAWVVFFRHAYVLMERTAHGHEQHDVMFANDDGKNRPYRMFGLFLTHGLVTVAVMVFAGELVGELFSLVLAVTIPASLMIIAINDSYLRAVNPVEVVEVISAIGAPYFALYGFLFMIYGSLQLVESILPGSLLLWPLSSFAAMYFSLVMFSLMGYVMYQYSAELGIDVAVSHDERADRQKRGPNYDPVVGPMERLIADGDTEGAINYAEQQFRHHWENVELHDRYHKLLSNLGKDQAMLQHAREFLPTLIKKRKFGAVLSIVQDCLAQDSEFHLNDADLDYQICHAAAEQRQYAVALDLMRACVKRHPKHERAAATMLVAAKLMTENLRQESTALVVLRQIQSIFPNTPEAEQAAAYEAFVTKLVEQQG